MKRILIYAFCFSLGLFVHGDHEIPKPGLVARYRATDVEVDEGGAVTRWPAAEGSNPVPLMLVKDLDDGQVPVRPVRYQLKVNGFEHAGVRFLAGGNGHRELLEAKALLPEKTEGRTVVVAYRHLGISAIGSARIGGFGSSALKPGDDRRVWNFGADTEEDGGYGSFRFDGAFLGPYPGRVPPEGELLLRAMILHPGDRFSDYIQPAHDFFIVKKVLNKSKAPKPVGPFPGDFYIGDVHLAGMGKDTGAFGWELFEVLVYDRMLSEEEVEQALKALNWRYTNPVPATP